MAPILIGRSGGPDPGGLLVEFTGRPFSLLASTRPVAPGLIVGGRGVAPGARVRSVLPIGGSQLDFELIHFIPLRVSSLALRYCEELLQATAGGNRFWCVVHGGILAFFQRQCIDRGQ